MQEVVNVYKKIKFGQHKIMKLYQFVLLNSGGSVV